MTKEEIQQILENINEVSMEQEASQLWKKDDVERLESRFEFQLPDDFLRFHEIVAGYSFPGDLLGIGEKGHDDSDPILEVYETEMRAGPWDSKFLPFLSIGNGDYFCLNTEEGQASRVYYYYHEVNEFEVEYSSFEEWIRDLPSFYY